MNRTQILSKQQIQQKLNRMAWQIFEANYQESVIIIAGINGNGFLIAQRLTAIIKEISDINVLLTEIKINKKEPFNSPIELSLKETDYVDKVVILVDDVLNSGKTMIYGVKHFLNVPVKKINTTALIDRKHPRFPIRTDYAGLVLSTSIKDHVAVELEANEGVYIE
ncbi:MAG: phosphoribosyltransferase family protein [Flavobacteriales bacterium]|nr:phosphoribosyltransferase family protein [Flavobacteriales bacterium]